MHWEGNLRKLETSAQADEHGQVAYTLRGADVLQALPPEDINAWVGERLHIHFGGQIHCRVSGQVLRKTYGEGMLTRLGRSIRLQWKAYCVLN